MSAALAAEALNSACMNTIRILRRGLTARQVAAKIQCHPFNLLKSQWYATDSNA